MGVVYIVMGVSGVGKTTIGKLLATKLGVSFYDADDYHPESNKNKMASGIPLQDTDRWPWLELLSQNIKKWSADGAVLACSALKESYRDILGTDGTVKFVFLEGSQEDITKRLAAREDHFFDPNLLQSQFDALEKPKNAIVVNAQNTPGVIVNNIMSKENIKNELGLIGLGVMGKSLARNFATKGVKISLYNRHVAGKEEKVASKFINQHKELENSYGYDDLEAFVNSLALPRKIFIMVNAGPAIDAVIQSLVPHLSAGDVLMDGGNSHYKNTQDRFELLKDKGIHFLGVGVSGGEKGALEGPSVMPGGSKEGYELVGAYLERIAARDKNKNACCTRVGDGGSGHFVKMIHNGIEYAEMQLIAEVYDVLKTNLQLDNSTISNYFKDWNQGALESYLLEISGHILTKKEGDVFLIDVILDKAKQKGTGGWSTTAALEIGTSLDTISQAVMTRIVSGYKEDRVKGEEMYKLSRKQTTLLSIETIKKAYKVARIINHCIGMEALRKASQEYNWDLNLSEITRIWTNGCIIRSQFMETLGTILTTSSDSLFLSNDIRIAIQAGLDDLISFQTETLKSHMATPVFSAATNYILAFTRGESSANMIQAQRDYFGAHTYERKDKTGNFHTSWED